MGGRRRAAVSAVAVVVAMASAACGAEEPGPVAADGFQGRPLAVVGADGRVRLAPGETVRLGGGTAFVTFEEVSGDSRCPIDAVCVWEGNAEVRLRVSPVGGESRTVTLGTHLEPRRTEVGGWTVLLHHLGPAPSSALPIDPADYRVELRVSHR